MPNMPVSDELLKGATYRALNLVKTQLRIHAKTDPFSFLLAVQFDTGEFHRMRTVEAQIGQMAGEDWMNHAHKKRAVTDALRDMLRLAGATPIVIVGSAANMFKTTPEFHKLPTPQQSLLMNDHEAQHAGVKTGLFTVQDVIWLSGQTAHRCCYVTQDIDPHSRTFIGQPNCLFMHQRDVEGTLKIHPEADPFDEATTLSRLEELKREHEREKQ